MVRINGTFGDFLDRNNLTVLRPILSLFQTSQGYGGLDTIPAYYGLLWCTPLGLRLAKQQLGIPSAENLDAKILAPGFTEIIERLAKKARADIRLNSRVKVIDRSKAGCMGGRGISVKSGSANAPSWLPEDCGYVTIKTEDDTFKCAHVVINVPVPQVIKSQLLEMTSAEKEILEDIGACNEWQTFLLRAEDVHQLDAVDTWPGNFEAPGKLVTTRMTPRIISQVGVEKAGSTGIEEFVTLSLQSQMLSADAILANVKETLTALNVTNLSKVDEFRASDYNCRFSHSGVAKGLPWAVDKLQGRQRTFFVGGSVSFEALEHIIAQAQTIVVPKLNMMMRCRDDQCCHCHVECEGAEDEAGCFQSCFPADHSLCGLTSASAAAPAANSESSEKSTTGWVVAVSILALLLLAAVSALVVIRKRRQHSMTGCSMTSHNLSL
jgi:hypothetical protein